MKKNHLEEWLLDPRSDEFFGQAFCVKLAALALLIEGEAKCPAAIVARQFGITRHAAGKHVRAARQIYGFKKAGNKK